jgi:hypothetical protein
MHAEETRVHETTHNNPQTAAIKDLPPVLEFYQQWRAPIDWSPEPLTRFIS